MLRQIQTLFGLGLPPDQHDRKLGYNALAIDIAIDIANAQLIFPNGLFHAPVSHLPVVSFSHDPASFWPGIQRQNNLRLGNSWRRRVFARYVLR